MPAWRILVLRIFSHVVVIGQFVSQHFFLRLILIVVLGRIVSGYAYLPWVDNNDIAVSALSSGSRLSQIQQVLSTDSAVEALIVLVSLVCALPVDDESLLVSMVVCF